MNVLNALNKRKNAMKANGADSLDILRENIQCFFNGKINTLMKEFVQTFFEPAIKNIKENTNENITEQQVMNDQNIINSTSKRDIFQSMTTKYPFDFH